MKNNKLIYMISFLSGFLSLAQEIIWMRYISFLGMSVPQTFSFTLAIFLLGIAAGAHVGKRICKNSKNLKVGYLGNIFLLAGIIDILLIICVYLYSYYFVANVLFLGCCVFICASVRGIIFPIVHHIGTEVSKSGAQISNVYFSNVFGSSLAPLLIGFVALDFFNTQQVYLIICLLTFLIAGLCQNKLKRQIFSFSFLVFPLVLIFSSENIFKEFSKNSYEENLYPKFILENKHGVIHVYEKGKDKIIFGANVYDGKLNTNIFHNSNGIDRAYLIAALNPEAENILVIGLSTGSWAKVLSFMPNIKKMTIIEINPNYIKLIKMYPEVRGILDDPRIEIVIDDGRKWLKKNDQKKFDIILMNTTWHWRAYGANLLSQNFIHIIHSRLNKDGLAFYNTTQSMNAYATAHQVFPYVYQFKYFALGANQQQNIIPSRLKNNLCFLRDPMSKDAVFSNEEECQKAADIITQTPLIPYENIAFNHGGGDLEIITDNNMITEFKYGKGL